MHTLSVALTDPAVLAVLGAVSLALLAVVGRPARRDFFFTRSETRRLRRLARLDHAGFDEHGNRLPLGSR